MKGKFSAAITRILGRATKTTNKKNENTYRPEININSVVYGPPPETKKPETALKGNLIPEENINPTVYGPPLFRRRRRK